MKKTVVKNCEAVCYPLVKENAMETVYRFADGSSAVVLHQATWGEIVIALLLMAILFIELYRLWREH